MVESAFRESFQVDRSGKHPEIGVDLGGTADPCLAAAVSTSHQVTDFAFHFWAGRAVVIDSGLVSASGPGPFDRTMLTVDRDAAAAVGGRAMFTQRTEPALFPEACDTGPVASPDYRGDHVGRTLNRVVINVDREIVFRVQPGPVHGRLRLDLVDAATAIDIIEQITSTGRGVAVYRRGVIVEVDVVAFDSTIGRFRPRFGTSAGFG